MYRNTMIHTPKTGDLKNVNIPTTRPVIFLAGPIRNAPKWQEKAIEILLEKNEAVFVASPTREISKHLTIFTEPARSEEYKAFERQRAWEQFYLNQAAEKGCILFWLPKESDVKEFEGKVYAHITMMELGEWIARKKMNPKINLVIGTDGDFPEWSTIEFELKTELPDLTICTSLDQSIDKALEYCRPHMLNLF